ncbi:MAG: hypothetical protein M3Q29_00675 [Chloroflexota bacterium]|nr:hypothetical protein [Chloroflexota bacterium]
MRYSIEHIDKGRVRPAIALRVHEDEAWDPRDGQVEIETAEASKHADLERLNRWGVVEFEHDRLSLDYRQLETILVHPEPVGV